MSKSSPSQPTQIKLRVSTAGEAVRVLRERYGERARVLAVKQVEAGGLKRLISKPQLEVIVELSPEQDASGKRPSTPAAPSTPDAGASVPDSKAAAEAEVTAVQPGPAADSVAQPPELGPASAAGGAVSNLYKRSGKTATASYFDAVTGSQDEAAAASAASQDEARLGTAANPVRRGTLEAVRRAIAMLESVGFDRSLIERIRAEIDFKDIGSLPAMDLYARICDWLNSHFPASSGLSLGSSRAFIGGSGVGKTAALCKTLSADVFIRGHAPAVLKIDSELPNPSDGLEIFCDIMGAPLLRDSEEIEVVSSDRPLLVDVPGFSVADGAGRLACRQALDQLNIEERILVINAAYESELIADTLAAGEEMGANRVVFTHLDETRKAGKLWKFLLNDRITPLFFSIGPNPAGDYTFEVRSYLLERTFPNGQEFAAAARRPSRGQPAREREELAARS